jgi:hypothetical protein
MTAFIISNIITFLSLIKETIKSLEQGFSFYKQQKLYEIDELIEQINMGHLKYGDSVAISGLFSDFVPAARKLIMPIQGNDLFFDPLPCRPFPINGYHCGLLQSFDSRFAADPSGLPLFYKDNTTRPIIDNYSGFNMEIKGTLTSIPFHWKNLLDLEKPFGIKVDSIELTGAEVPTFGCFLWAIGLKKADLPKPSEGIMISSNDFFSCVYRISNSKHCLFLNGGGQRILHGKEHDSFDTSIEYHGINLLNDKEYQSHVSFLKHATQNCVIEAEFDMNLLPPNRIAWIKRRIGI